MVYSFPGVSITSDHNLQSWRPEGCGQGVGMAVPSGALVVPPGSGAAGNPGDSGPHRTSLSPLLQPHVTFSSCVPSAHTGRQGDSILRSFSSRCLIGSFPKQGHIPGFQVRVSWEHGHHLSLYTWLYHSLIN